MFDVGVRTSWLGLWRQYSALNERPVGDVILARRDEGSVVLQLRTGVYFELDRAATEIVTLLQAQGIRKTVETLSERYDEPAEHVGDDVARVVQTLRESTAVVQQVGRRPTAKGSFVIVSQWWRMPLRQKLSVLHVLMVVSTIEVLIRIQPVDRVARLVGAPLGYGITVSGEQAALDPGVLTAKELRLLGSLAWFHRAWVFDGTCLRRALAAGWLFRRRKPHLVIGLTESDGVLAHAWLVIDGCTFDGLPGAQPFGRLDAGWGASPDA